jgi:hypothetical protein
MRSGGMSDEAHANDEPRKERMTIKEVSFI